MENKHQDKMFFTYGDIFFSYFFNHDTICSDMVRNHSLTYVYGGEMIIEERGNHITIGKGECAFIKRDNRIVMTKQSKDGEHYKGIFMNFHRSYLRDIFRKMGNNEIPNTNNKYAESVVKLPPTAEIDSLFHSMTPYFNYDTKPRDEFMQLKLQEGIYALLNINEKFYPTLFDFAEPWKIDILEFLNENYMTELSMEDIAHFTGRSLATFKRDFKKISELTPQKWIIRKRLEVAHELIRQNGMKIKDVCMDVGFKNISHFSKVYKEAYGYSPTQ